jgi:hypothetical protein
MRAPIAILAGAAAILAAAGCGAAGDRTPAACLDGVDAYLGALRLAPADVRLRGGVPIGDCLPENQKGGELATVGTAMVGTATRLNSSARAAPGGPASLELGYLLGAVQARAERTGGIHDELLRRLTAAARYSPGGRPLPRRFLRAYRLGRDAGRASPQG